MMQSVIVKDILKNKEPHKVWSVSMDESVFTALSLMAEKEVGALMVTDKKGTMVGIFSERDYARKIILKGKTSQKTTVKAVMTAIDKVYSVKPETSVDDCMVLMTGKHVRHLPVFDGGKFVGLVSIGDVVKSAISKRELLIEQLSNYISGRH